MIFSCVYLYRKSSPFELEYYNAIKSIMRKRNGGDRVNKGDSSAPRKQRKAVTIEGREEQMIAMAADLAEEKLRNGTASNQLIVHLLKLGSTKERLEKDILAEQKKLVAAKTESLESQKRMDELYASAIKAMREYNGSSSDEEDEEEYEDY